jgi:hypothetical protein
MRPSRPFPNSLAEFRRRAHLILQQHRRSRENRFAEVFELLCQWTSDDCSHGVENRAILGFYAMNPKCVCYDVRKLGAFLDRGKSWVNAAFQELGFRAIKAHTCDAAIVNGINSYLWTSTELRLWTQRVRINGCERKQPEEAALPSDDPLDGTDARYEDWAEFAFDVDVDC